RSLLSACSHLLVSQPAAIRTVPSFPTRRSSDLVGGSGTFFGPPDFELWTASLSLQQTIWDFGRSLNRYRQAQAEARQALARQQLVEELLDVAAEAAYRTALASDELVTAMEESRRQARAHLELARGRAEVGLAAPYDLSRAEVG